VLLSRHSKVTADCSVHGLVLSPWFKTRARSKEEPACSCLLALLSTKSSVEVNLKTKELRPTAANAVNLSHRVSGSWCNEVFDFKMEVAVEDEDDWYAWNRAISSLMFAISASCNRVCECWGVELHIKAHQRQNWRSADNVAAHAHDHTRQRRWYQICA
jgi:hypothetical protein